MTKSDTAHILIVEDDAAVQGTLARALERTPYTYTAVSSLADAINYIGTGKADLVLLDLHLPDGDGTRLLHPLKSRWPDCIVLILTGQSDEADRVRGFRLGADDYVVKPFSILELLERIRVRLARTQVTDASVTIGNKQIDLPGHEVIDENGNRISLTRQEARVLHMLVQKRGQPVARAELLSSVWGLSGEAPSRSLDVVMGNLRKKIEEAPREPRRLLTVYGHGYQLADD